MTYVELLPLFTAGVVLTLWPQPIARLIGAAYWNMARFTALGKTEDTRRLFFAKKHFWFRVLGVFFVILSVAGASQN